MLQVLTPEQVIASREILLADLDEALLGDPAHWQNGFPDNFELYNAVLRIFEMWEARPAMQECFCCGHGGEEPHACG